MNGTNKQRKIIYSKHQATPLDPPVTIKTAAVMLRCTQTHLRTELRRYGITARHSVPAVAFETFVSLYRSEN